MADLATFNNIIHNYNDQQFQAARALLEMPLEWKNCTPGQRVLFRECFRDYSVDLARRLNGGDVAEVVLQHQWRGLNRLRSVAA